MNVALTGATGFLGLAVAAALRRRGVEVTALVRSAHGVSGLVRLGVVPMRAPLRAGRRLDEALQGTTVLVHLAYDMRASGEANLSAFDTLLAATVRAGISRIVHASSVVVYDAFPDAADDTPITEASAIGARPAVGYRAAKIAMEERLLGGSIPAAIVQPTVIYGPGGALWTMTPIRRLRSGGLILPDPSGKAPIVHVDDVAEAIALATFRADAPEGRFLVSGPAPVTWFDLFSGYARLAAVPPPTGISLPQVRARTPGFIEPVPAEPVPAELVPVEAAPQGRNPARTPAAARISAFGRRLLGHRRFEALVERAQRLSGPSGPVWPTASELALYAASPMIDGSLAERRLEYRPKVDLATGLDTIEEHFSVSSSID